MLDAVIAQQVVDEVGWVSARHERLHVGGARSRVDAPTQTVQQLLDALVQQLVPTLPRPVGATVAQLVPPLHAHLSATPHVIVIDNLETVTDVAHLLPILQQLAGPTKFLLTSRERLYNTPNVYHAPVPELSPADALALIRQEAAWSNLPELAQKDDALLVPIYETVGGNPLALRLVVGQAHLRALPAILDDLQQARGQTAEAIYTYIYQQAWDKLPAVVQDVLLVMPLVQPAGEPMDFIMQVSGLDEDVVTAALQTLITCNLVDALGDVQARRYTIHGLTRTFLAEQVSKWQVASGW